MKTFKYVYVGIHATGPICTDDHTIRNGDIISVLATMEFCRIIMMPSGAVRYLEYPFEEEKYFVEISS